ncbi:MAG TPA: thermonuclease family protein [Patescibacteria group bacterium]|nr:thermonuclease family protein [Patescibacteria group bacterium]
MELGQVIKRVPGFRSGSKIKAGIASVFYLLAIFFILLIVVPPPETEKSQIEEQAATPTEGILESETEEEREEVLVARVIDGDTIEIEGGQKVRYIGIDAPESVDPNEPVGCYAQEASEKNKELVLNKKVRLEKDVSEMDRYGRLLRYVWVGDLLVNEYLVREGYAQSSTYPPDVKYQDKFIEAQKKAREEEKGLWSIDCDTWGQFTPTPRPTLKATPTPTPISKSTIYTCDCSKTCTQISSCEEAQYQLNVCGCSARDGDKDGIACDGPPLNCQK